MGRHASVWPWPWTTLLAVIALSIGSVTSHAKINIQRSIGFTSSNSLQGNEVTTDVHPHELPGKPSKFDLDINQYTETDDRILSSSETTTMPTDFGITEIERRDFVSKKNFFFQYTVK